MYTLVQLNGIQIHMCHFFIISSVVALKEKGEITLLLTVYQKHQRHT
jgi:hypothetical protein